MKKSISYDEFIREKIRKGEDVWDDLKEMIRCETECHLLESASIKPNSRSLKKTKNSSSLKDTVKLNINKCLDYGIQRYDVLNKDAFVLFCADLFHRILYYNASKGRDWAFLYDEYYSIVQNTGSVYYEKILDCLKNLKSLDNDLDITPFVRELYDASEFFDNTYLSGNIKLFCYQFAYELSDYLSEEEKITLESIVLKTVGNNEFVTENTLYNSAMANYLYAGDIEGADIDAHEEVIMHESCPEVIELFRDNVVKPILKGEKAGITRVKKD